MLPHVGLGLGRWLGLWSGLVIAFMRCGAKTEETPIPVRNIKLCDYDKLIDMKCQFCSGCSLENIRVLEVMFDK